MREFLKEYAIIVVGVLTALAAEQGAEWLHWRHLVDEGRRDLAASYVHMQALATERDIDSPCIGGRLSEIAAILDQASRTGRLPPVGDIGSPALRLWAETEWPTLVAAQTAVHFPRDEARGYAGIADYARTVDIDANREIQDWTTLYTIVGPGRPTSDVELSKLRSALSSALYYARDMRLAGFQIGGMIDHRHLQADTAAKARAAAFTARIMKRNGHCPPIGPAAAAYDHAPLEGADSARPYPRSAGPRPERPSSDDAGQHRRDALPWVAALQGRGTMSSMRSTTVQASMNSGGVSLASTVCWKRANSGPQKSSGL